MLTGGTLFFKVHFCLLQECFLYRENIYKHIKELDERIDEYNITLNGEQIFKKYMTILKDAKGTKYDDIFEVHFKNFYHTNGDLFAWMWVGLSRFKKAIPKTNQMRGLRLRKDNIQIGGEDSLQKLFKEDRGNSYFVGEVFAVNKDLIPNSQRDYFNENKVRAEFERELRKYFNEELHRIYNDASAINSAYRKIDESKKIEAAFKKKEAEGNFVDEDHRERERENVLDSMDKAASAKARIRKMKNKASDLMERVINRIEVERSTPIAVDITPKDSNPPKKNIPPRRTDRLSQYSRRERKLISKIFKIILEITDSETAETIISRIEERLNEKKNSIDRTEL